MRKIIASLLVPLFCLLVWLSLVNHVTTAAQKNADEQTAGQDTLRIGSDNGASSTQALSRSPEPEPAAPAITYTNYLPLIDGPGHSVTEWAVVEPAGGTLTFHDGNIVLTFPAGAVTETTTIFVTAEDDPLQDPWLAGTMSYHFLPEGLRFQDEVQLSIGYNASQLPAAVPENTLRAFKVISNTWQLVDGSSVDVNANTVSAAIDGFSRYTARAQAPTVTLNLGRSAELGYKLRWMDVDVSTEACDDGTCTPVDEETGGDIIQGSTLPDLTTREEYGCTYTAGERMLPSYDNYTLSTDTPAGNLATTQFENNLTLENNEQTFHAFLGATASPVERAGNNVYSDVQSILDLGFLEGGASADRRVSFDISNPHGLPFGIIIAWVTEIDLATDPELLPHAGGDLAYMVLGCNQDAGSGQTKELFHLYWDRICDESPDTGCERSSADFEIAGSNFTDKHVQVWVGSQTAWSAFAESFYGDDVGTVGYGKQLDSAIHMEADVTVRVVPIDE